MADYGNHPTLFSNFSNDRLFAMYRGESWSQMNEYMRRELLQETVNRSAKLNGEVGACYVEFADLESNVSGAQSGNVIQLNRERFVNDRVLETYDGHVLETHLEDANLQALETVLHEDIHAWQNQLVDGTIQCADPELLAEYQANNFDIAMVQLADGTMDVGQQYLSGESKNGGYYLYYLQSTERDAHRYSELRTQQIMEQLAQKHGNEPSFDAYRLNIATNGFETTLADAKLYFGAETVEQDINITLKNAFHLTDEPVTSPLVENAVKKEMILSLQESMKASQEQNLNTQPVVQNETPGIQAEPPGVSNDGGVDME